MLTGADAAGSWADEVLLTLDLDWCSDEAIEDAAAILRAHAVRATWFVTHQSPAVERLAETPELFELGIHPNFLLGSTHGQTPQGVLQHCLALVPDARCVRTHSLYQSTPLLNLFLETQLSLDASTVLPHCPNLRPVEHHWHGRGLLRVPCYWEDDVEMQRERPCWQGSELLAPPGLKVFNFHPVHVFGNVRDHRLGRLPQPGGARAFPALGESVPRSDQGPRTTFLEVVRVLADRRGGMRLSDLLDRWLAERGDSSGTSLA